MRLGRFGVMGVLALLALAAGGVTFAAYTATTQSNSNRIEAGSVKLSDNGDGTSLMTMAAGVPGVTTSACVKVTFDGSLASAVRLYGTTTGNGLDQYLDLKVTRGTYSPSEPAYKSCTNFQADGTDYIGAGNGVIYDGTLQGFPDDYAAGLVDPTGGSPESWTNAEAHVYRFDVTIQQNFAAQTLNAAQTFSWEARSQ
jgi:predicted ribosomally synthesized peptide with SipW-like signal peptide